MIVITGATGNTGKVITEKLLARGEKVRVIGRDAQRLEAFVRKGAEAFVANAQDAGALEKAFAGASAVYLMIPPHKSSPEFRADQERTSDALARALERAGVSHAVVLSSIGADKPDRTGPVVGLHNLEQKLNRIASLNALHLRAGYFLENLLAQVGVIRNFGMVAGPLRADLPVAMIATRDIAAVAAEALAERRFSGKQTRELLGARDVTYAEITRLFGKALNRPELAYQQMPASVLKPALMQMGFSASGADMLMELAEALNSGYLVPLEPRSSSNTTPTTLETFVAEEFVPRFRGISASA